MACAFGDDGGHLHLGGDRVVTRARRSLGGQLVGTGFPHALRRRRRVPPARAVRRIVVRVVPTAFLARLMPRLRGACGLPSAAVPAVDVPTILGLAAIEDATASFTSASDLDEYLDDVHERAALGTCPASPTSGTFAPSASTRDGRLRDATPGPSLFTLLADRLRRDELLATSRRSVPCPDFYGS